MKLRIESETGEFINELDLKDMDIERMIQYSLLRLQAENSDIKYELPLKNEDVTKLIQYAVVSMLKDEISLNKDRE